ncbi:MAG TPA: saccharopine dehydrogenase [Flavobacteriales bacterium]|nr:saccharopine dehydrogenase [Flavobacteriales bacterium]|tara:strand:+ start:97 stop:1428 length:1332 start_codon:yes stop_codon:yes gene_type:complete
MKKILVIGAGRSSSSLIRYLTELLESNNWHLRIADRDLDLAKEKINGAANAEAISFNALNRDERIPHLEWADIVVSMLPAAFHLDIAKDCVLLKKNLITPSYITPEMKALEKDCKANGVFILNELGLDPGIDHMSAMKIIDGIKAQGGEIERFESFTGGLVAPQSDTNPWSYKFTWNPRNVILAGQGSAATFLQNGKYKFVPYNKLFSRTKEIEIDSYGVFEGYANRDSLSYIEVYGLTGIPTIYRGTLRRKGYSEAWDTFVQLGCTDDSYVLPDTENMTYREYINSFLIYHTELTVEKKLQDSLGLSNEVMDKLKWLGIFEDKIIGVKGLSPAKVLQKKLEEKWSLEPDDKDLIVMYHKFSYSLKGENFDIISSLAVEGEDQTYTGMSNTVGLPLGIAVKLVLQGKLSLTGVHLPVIPEIYEPILKELGELGVVFKEKEYKC